jgi:hypothetical protein
VLAGQVGGPEPKNTTRFSRRDVEWFVRGRGPVHRGDDRMKVGTLCPEPPVGHDGQVSLECLASTVKNGEG